VVVGRWDVVLASAGKRETKLGYGEAVWVVGELGRSGMTWQEGGWQKLLPN
jgi:hypothetical protein